MIAKFIDGTWNNATFSVFLYAYQMLDKSRCGKQFSREIVKGIPIMV